MILLIDNYDGCVYNLYQLIGTCLQEEGKTEEIRIVRNDHITPEAVRSLNPSHIVISGGAVAPEKAGSDLELVKELAGAYPMLGVCLGFRVICAAYGGKEVPLKETMQGKPSRILLEKDAKAETGILNGLPDSFLGARYQSTTIAKDSIKAPLHIIACAEDGDVMAVEAAFQGTKAAANESHAPLIGLQWHPESFMSEYGKEVMKNFLAM